MTIVQIDRVEAVTSKGGGFRRRITKRRSWREDQICAQWMVERFLSAMNQISLSNDTYTALGARTLRLPQITAVQLGIRPRMWIRPLAGQVLGDFVEIADRIAAALHVASVRLVQQPNGLIRCELVRVDPLASRVELALRPLTSVRQKVVLGRVETGENVSVSLVDLGHMVVQGMTRSGKSRWTYGLLGQLAGCPDLIIAGSDVTDVLLRPFTGTRHADWQATGAHQLERHVEVVEGLVELMNQRHTRIPMTADVLPVSDRDPIVLVVIEEYGALVDLLGTEDTREKTKLQPRFRAAVRMLLAAGAKVGMRVLLITQRADASGPAGIGGYERGQAAVRLTFRVDNHEAVKLLHPEATKQAAEAHRYSPAGLALISGPELPLTRLRAPHLAGYREYVDAVHTACRPVTER
jgi:hypothetical protein